MRSSSSSRDAPRHAQARQDEGGGGSSTGVGATTQLPLLPLFDHVLLPGGFLRVTIPAGWHKSSALVELLLQQHAGELLVAAVPILTGQPGAGAAAGSARMLALPALPGDTDEPGGGAIGDSDTQLDLDRLHSTGTAARVLQISRRTAAGGWAVTLEGRCRLHVRDVRLVRQPHARGEVYEAVVEQLDYLPPRGAAAGGWAGASSSAGAAGGAASKEQEELTQELLTGTRRLFLLIQGEAQGREVAARVARALAQQGAARMSDVLGSLVARTLRDRLALLATLDVTARLRMVVDLLGQLLDVAEKAAASGGRAGGAARRGGRGLGGPGRGLRLPSLGGDGPDEDEDEEDGRRELAALMQKLKAANPPPEVLRAAQREFKRLQRGSEQHPGYGMSLAYLETLADLPWSRLSIHQAPTAPNTTNAAATSGSHSSTAGHAGSDEEPEEPEEPEEGRVPAQAVATAGAPAAPAPLPLTAVRQRLDDAHYGLDKIKERIVQYVAVQRLRGWDARAPILCFIGPPGVGKTSLARSIAEVLGRPFQRISLGGVRDEAEIRGHRRTYIGAMPGRLIQAVRKAGVRDPVLLLDEVDKLGRDSRGDPAAGLLEVLDPEQNASFVDTYLGVPFDLSAAVCVATANRAADIPPPLLDRLEVVQLGGYTLDEKVHIAERHLIPRLLGEHGLHQGQLIFPSVAVRAIIEGYTAEAGVRSLSRCLAAVCRHVAVQVVQQQEQEEVQLGTGSGRGVAATMLGAVASAQGRGAAQAAAPLAPPRAAAMVTAAAGPGSSVAAAAHMAPGWASASSPNSSGPASGGGGLSLQLHPEGMPAGPARVRLWMQLLALTAVDPASVGRALGGSAAAVTSAVGGYPWPQLQKPRSRRVGGSAAGAAAPAAHTADCTCSPRRQHQGWFGWLRWARHDSAAEHVGAAEPAGNADLACACAGGCADADCCCHAALGRRQGGGGGGRDAEWGEHGHAGTAADSDSWEASWRGAASSASLAKAAPPLCGPGSMQIVRHYGGRGPATAGASHAWQEQQQQQQQQHCGQRWQQGLAEESFPREEVPEGLDAVVDASLPAALGEPQRAQREQRQVIVDEVLIEAVLGPRRFEGHNSAERVAAPGTAAGLVWTSVGGKVQYIECISVGTGRGGRGGQLTLTGQLGDVLEESARIALSWVRAHAAALGLPADASCPSRKWDVHVHLPAGAVPKDGPSAGVTLAAALVSLFTGRCVRPDTAMTGELTLRGLVLPVGGIKEKLLAAQAAGMARVLVPGRNMPDVQADVPTPVRQGLEVVPCHKLEDVLRAAFDPPLELSPSQPMARL